MRRTVVIRRALGTIMSGVYHKFFFVSFGPFAASKINFEIEISVENYKKLNFFTQKVLQNRYQITKMSMGVHLKL